MYQTIEKRTRHGRMAQQAIGVSQIRQKKAGDQVEITLPFFIANPRHLNSYVKVEYDKVERALRLTPSDEMTGYKATTRDGSRPKYGFKFTPSPDILSSMFPNGKRRYDVFEFVDASKDGIEFRLP